MKGMWNREGFTLMEVIISLAILALAFVALLGMRDKSIKRAGEAERLTRATVIAQQIMGMIELNGLDKDEDGGTMDGFRWLATQSPYPIGSLKELRLTLWQDTEEIIEIVEYMP